MSLRELGEDKLLARIASVSSRDTRVISGIGDDCAVLKAPGGNSQWLLLKTDAVIEGIHFESSAPPAAIGWKAMMRPLSDIAAMSGVPEFALVTLALPPATELPWVRELYRGLRRAAAQVGVAIVGGETTATRGEKMIAVDVAGKVEPERCVFRSGGKVGDALFVTGHLGGSIGGKHLEFTARLEEARWLTSRFDIHAMMDLSDGLAADLPRLARASRLGFVLDADVPRARGSSLEAALGDGEDYELFFALSPREGPPLERAWSKKFPRLALTRIGRFTRRSKSANRELKGGYDHFRERR